jgi:hypothetical protein
MVRMSAVWDRTAAFAGERFGALLAIALATLVLPNAITSALAPLRATAAPMTGMVLGLAMLVAGLIALWGQLAVTALALEPGAGMRGALRTGGQRLPAMAGTALLLLLALLILTAPIGYLVLSAGNVTMDMNGMRTVMTGEGRRNILLASLVTTLVLLWIGARLAVLMPVVVAERRGLRSIPRAFALTRGLALKLIGVLLLYFVVLGIVTYAAQTVFGTVFALVLGGEGAVTMAGVLTALAVALVSAVFSVLASLFLAVLYRSIRAAREGALAP